jgi:LysR family transcriptional activator of mexEF-oprN operon
VGVFIERAAWHRQRALFDWHFVCVYNPALVKARGKRLTLKEYLRHPHLLTSFSAGLSGLVDELLRKQGLTRQVVFSSRNFATSPFIVRQMPAITTVPTFAAATWRDALGLAVSPCRSIRQATRCRSCGRPRMTATWACNGSFR